MALAPQENDTETVTVEGQDFSKFCLENEISCVPVDDAQDDLFDEYRRFLESYFFPAVPPGFPNNQELECPEVLDCGCGTGAWIDDLMDGRDADDSTYPDALVTGIDVYHGSPGMDLFIKLQWNLNASFRIVPIRNILQRGSFDLINSRFLIDGINARRWEPLIREYKELLKEEGWLQMAELGWTFHSENGHNLPNLTSWSDNYNDALGQMDKKPNIAGSLERLVRFAGFEGVRCEVHNIPLGGWDSDDGSSASAINFVHGMLKSLALVPFIRKLRMNEQDRDKVVEAAQFELRTPGARIFQKLTVVYGRKPRNSG